MAAKRLESKLVELMRERGATLVAAESCTAGAIADAVTRVAGSSEVFWGAFVTYQERAKIKLLGVSRATLARHGAVSREVAARMAEQGYRIARRTLSGKQTLIAISTTGVAGPGGGSSRTPVGLCYIGVASNLSGGRARVVRVVPARLSRSAQKKRFTELALREAFKEVTRCPKR